MCEDSRHGRRTVELDGVGLEGGDASWENNAVLGGSRENVFAIFRRAIKPVRIVERASEQAPDGRKPLQVEIDLGRTRTAEIHRHSLAAAGRLMNESPHCARE